MKSNPEVKPKQTAPQKANSGVKKENFQNRATKAIPKPGPNPDPKTPQNHGQTDALINGKDEGPSKTEHKATKRKVNGDLPENSRQMTKKKKVEEPAEKKPTE